MKMWRTMIKPPFVAVLMFMVAGTSAPAFAMGPPHGGPGGPLGLKMLMELNLSADQRARVADLIQTQRAEREDHRAQVEAARKAFRSATEAAPFNEETVRAAFQEMAPIMEEEAIGRARFLAAFKQILTDEQLAAIDSKRAQGNGKNHEHRQFQARMLDTWLGMNDQ